MGNRLQSSFRTGLTALSKLMPVGAHFLLCLDFCKKSFYEGNELFSIRLQFFSFLFSFKFYLLIFIILTPMKQLVRGCLSLWISQTADVTGWNFCLFLAVWLWIKVIRSWQEAEHVYAVERLKGNNWRYLKGLINRNGIENTHSSFSLSFLFYLKKKSQDVKVMHNCECLHLVPSGPH